MKEHFKRYIQIAQAMHCNYKSLRCFHVAFIFEKGKNKVVSIGWNEDKTHPLNKQYPYKDFITSTHAEMRAIIKAKHKKEDFSDCNMLVVRIDYLGKVKNSKPCVGCQALIEDMGINKVWHSDDAGNIVSVK